MAVRIKFAPFMSRSEISPSQTQRGSWKLLSLFGLHGKWKALESKGTAATVALSHAGFQGMCWTRRRPIHAHPCLEPVCVD